MKTEPIAPARIDFDVEGTPHAPLFGDVYHPREGALQQAQHAFLAGNGLPARWAGRQRFTILETGFGLGHNFVATWAAWRDDPARCERLCFVSIDKHPPAAADLARAHAGSPLRALADELQRAWPPATPNLHVLDFEAGRVRLLLGLGDVAALLPELRLQADAFFLDGFAPARNEAMWQPRVFKALARAAAPDATLATWSVARPVRDGLAAAGFDVQRAPGSGGKREITVARFAPRFDTRRNLRPAPAGRSAIVVGAGIAGACSAAALRAEGIAVTVVELGTAPPPDGPGPVAGIFHGTVHADDGRHARLFRAAALHAGATWQRVIEQGVPGSTAGLLRLGDDVEAMQALLQRQQLPARYLQAMAAADASALAGVPLPGPCWFYPRGGWIAPMAARRTLLAGDDGLRRIEGTAVQALAQCPAGWRVLDANGAVIAEAPIVVLANAADAARLLAPLGHAPWPLQLTRGQVTIWQGAPAAALRLPVGGGGYAIPLPGEHLLCGATQQPIGDADGDAMPDVRDADHAHNLDRLQRLTGIAPPPGSALVGRAGRRVHGADALPLAGAVPLAAMPPGQRLDQPRIVPRTEGLFVLSALGGRGLTLAPLLARLVAAQAAGAPWPLEQDLVDAVDPARWQVRAARRAAGSEA